MKDLLAPTINYAREGFPVSEVIAYYWQKGAANLQKWPGFAATLCGASSAEAIPEVQARRAATEARAKLRTACGFIRGAPG